jgi:hypothetical protein
MKKSEAKNLVTLSLYRLSHRERYTNIKEMFPLPPGSRWSLQNKTVCASRGVGVHG